MKKKLLTLLLITLLYMTSINTINADNISQIIGNNNTVIFIDVPENHWAREQILAFANAGIINGYTDGSFRPENNVTREEFSKLLVATFHVPVSAPKEQTFADVPLSHWSAPYIEMAKEFMTAYDNPLGGMPSFQPNVVATREDITVALVRMLGLTGNDAENPHSALSTFSDGEDISPALLPYVSLAVERSLIKGFQDYTFRPQKGITRAEVVTLLSRATKKAVSTINAELDVITYVEYSKDGKTATIYVTTEEGANVKINNQSVIMTPTDMIGNHLEKNYSFGAFNYVFNQEEKKTIPILVEKGKKAKEVQVEISYAIDAPTIQVTESPTFTNKKSVTLKGLAKDKKYKSSELNLIINEQAVPINGYGEWSKELILKEGNNEFKLILSNPAGKNVIEKRTVSYNIPLPSLKINTVPTSTNEKIISLSGTVKDSNYNYSELSLTVNGEKIYINNWNDGQWEKTFSLTEGNNDFTFILTNPASKSVTEKRTVSYGVPLPALKLNSVPVSTNEKTVSLSGMVKDSNYNYSELTLTINGEKIYINNWNDGYWDKTFSLTEGNNEFTFILTNPAGKSVTEKRTVSYGVPLPTLKINNVPVSTTKNSISLSGTVKDSNYNYSELTLTINGEKIYISNWYDGQWDKTFSLTEGNNDFTFILTNPAGKSVTENKSIFYEVSAPQLTFTNLPTFVYKNTVTIEGKINDAVDTLQNIFFSINGESVSVGYSGNWSKTLNLTEGENTITFVTANSFGKKSSETHTITYEIPDSNNSPKNDENSTEYDKNNLKANENNTEDNIKNVPQD